MLPFSENETPPRPIPCMLALVDLIRCSYLQSIIRQLLTCNIQCAIPPKMTVAYLLRRSFLRGVRGADVPSWVSNADESGRGCRGLYTAAERNGRPARDYTAAYELPGVIDR